MLIKFSIENYKSIYDKLELDFTIKVNESNKKEVEENPFVIKINEDYISKLCLFYGHNGSGKTNIFEALFNLSLCNHNNSLLKLLYEPNCICEKGKESKFEIQFYSNKLNDSNEYSLYKYEIGIKNKDIENNNFTKKNIQITSEILKKGDDTIFERENNKLINNIITNDNKIMIPSNRTVLSFFRSIHTKEDEYFNNIINYFKLFELLPSATPSLKSLSNSDFIGEFSNRIYNKLDSLKILDFYIDLIKIADVGIDNMTFETKENDKKPLINFYNSLERDSNRKELSEDKKDELKLILKIIKRGIENNSFPPNRKQIFTYRNKWKKPFEEVESDGTKMYASHMFNIVIALKEGRLSLHDEFYGVQSDLIKTAFLLFTKNRYKEIEQTSQLFMTTHDIELMYFKYLLLEQIKFVVKDENKTYVYSASDIEGLDKNNLVECYRENKLGAKYFPRAYDIPTIISKNTEEKMKNES
ncbi:abortive infection protein [Brachyspira aalborgi]|uniref:Abortive infection protein n=1 Tax=Brachyspira aalborgi TaxID=29522 RepID=A0A5C8D2K5_9SPIR|nr:ATP-binding protein [Brachyspira aalborgi]TXJ19710.1 abortive infection protein [Brachyspira aalborgi]